MNTRIKLIASTVWILLSCFYVRAQMPDWELDQMPPDLETDFALSALPSHLRDQATVLLLDPKKGYYTARQGTNGFVTFVCRTEWERAEFIRETFSAISFDAEGAKTLVPVFIDVAKMRATGKYTPSEMHDTIVKGIKKGLYKAPSRAGISYMLAPMMRTRLDTGVESIIMPHYMFYAPNVTNADIGGSFNSSHPFLLDGDKDLNDGHAIFNYIIMPAGEAETNKIVEENEELLNRLTAFKHSLTVARKTGKHHH